MRTDEKAFVSVQVNQRITVHGKAAGLLQPAAFLSFINNSSDRSELLFRIATVPYLYSSSTYPFIFK